MPQEAVLNEMLYNCVNNQPVTNSPVPRGQNLTRCVNGDVSNVDSRARVVIDTRSDLGPDITDLNGNSNIAYYVPQVQVGGTGVYLLKITYDQAFDFIELEHYVLRQFSDKWYLVAEQFNNAVVFYQPLGQGGGKGKGPAQTQPKKKPQQSQPKVKNYGSSQTTDVVPSKNIMRDINRAAATAALTSFAGPFAPLLTDVGEKGANSLYKWLRGSGDYVSAPDPVVNSIIKPSSNKFFQENGAQLQLNESRGWTTVSRREKMVTIIAPGTGAFTNNIFPLDVSDYGTWPKLAAEAENFEECRVRAVVVELKSMATGYASNVSLGEHGIACQYNSLAVPYQDMNSLQMSSTSVTTNSAQGILFGVECADNMVPYNRLYINNSTVPNNATNALLRSMGNLEIATQYPSSIPAGTLMAEVWIHYTVDLYNEINPRPRMGYYHTIGTGCSNAAPLGNAGTLTQYVASYGNLDAGDTVPSIQITGTQIFFPKARLGDYYVIDMIYTLANVNLSGGSVICSPFGFTFDPIVGQSQLSSVGNFTTGTVTGTNPLSTTVYSILHLVIRCSMNAGISNVPALTFTSTGQQPATLDLSIYSVGNGYVNGTNVSGGL